MFRCYIAKTSLHSVCMRGMCAGGGLDTPTIDEQWPSESQGGRGSEVRSQQASSSFSRGGGGGHQVRYGRVRALCTLYVMCLDM
jgi:hypothetical protein